MDNKADIDQIEQMKTILRNHHDLDKTKVWFDLVAYAVIGWSAFIITCLYPNLLTFIIATYFMYRGTLLVHEVSHIAKKIKFYRSAFNILFGWANSYPVYIGDTHLFHHGKRTYGTKRDPEYKFINDFSIFTLIRPLLSSLILPFIQLIRFGIFPLFCIFLPKDKKLWIYQNISTLAFTMDYKRPIRNVDSDLARMIRNDLMCSLYKLIFIGLIAIGALPINSLLVWYAMFVISSTLNMYRAYFNHFYENETLEPMSWEDHLLDTVTINPGIASSLVFVNGLNYHAIHHLFPELPYTNLAAAHKDLIDNLPEGHIYKKNTFDGLIPVILHFKKMKELRYEEAGNIVKV